MRFKLTAQNQPPKEEFMSLDMDLYHGNRKGDFPPEHRRFAGAIFLTSNVEFAKHFAGLYDDEEERGEHERKHANVWKVRLKPGVKICNCMNPKVMAKLNLQETLQGMIDEKYEDKTNGTSFRKVKGGQSFKGYTYKDIPADPENGIEAIKAGSEFDIEHESQSVYHYLWRVRHGAWRVIECKPVIDQIRAAGYDGFFVVERGAKNVAIFDDKSIATSDAMFKREGMDEETKKQIANVLRAAAKLLAGEPL